MTVAALADYSAVLSRLDRCRPIGESGRRWTARCPAHPDRRPSLYLYVGDSGALVARCMAHGCAWTEIVAATGTRPLDWFPHDEPAPRRPPMKEVAVYPYRDEAGRVVFEVVRYEPKTFRQRRPHESGTGWTWDMDGVERVPYRLPELLASHVCAPVFVAEGEKDVDRLWSLGLVATCNPGGAGRWDVDFGRYLRGRRVVVIPDNDHAGRQHACTVAGSAPMHGAASVRILSLPVPEKGDVSDWLADIRDPAQARASLLALVRGCPGYPLTVPPPPHTDPPGFDTC